MLENPIGTKTTGTLRIEYKTTYEGMQGSTQVIYLKICYLYIYSYFSRLAVSERQKYISRVKAAVYDLEKDKKFLESFEEEMEDFDEYLTRTLDVYLEYLRNFVSMIQVLLESVTFSFHIAAYCRLIHPFSSQHIRKTYLNRNGNLSRQLVHIFLGERLGWWFFVVAYFDFDFVLTSGQATHSARWPVEY